MTGIERSEANGGNHEGSESPKNIVLIKGNCEEIRKTIIPLLAKALTFDVYFDHPDGIVVISDDNIIQNDFDQFSSYVNTFNTFFQNIQSENYTDIITSILKHITDLTESDYLLQYYKEHIKLFDTNAESSNTIKQYLQDSREILKTLISKIVPTASDDILDILVKHLTADMISTKLGEFTIESIKGRTLPNIRNNRDTTREGQMRKEPMKKERKKGKTTSLKSTLNSTKDFSFLGKNVEAKYCVPWNNMNEGTQREFRSKFTLNCESADELKKRDQAYTFFSDFLELSLGLAPNDKKNPKNIFRRNLLYAVGQNTVQQMISMAENFIKNYSS